MDINPQASIARRLRKGLKCPRCKKELQVVFKEDVEVHVCPHCNGIWVDVIEEKQLLQIKPEAFTIDELYRLRKFYKSLGRDEIVHYVPCPLCDQLMHRKNWGSHSGVVVDKCVDHGTWYDEGEIEKIREFVALGGVEYEKLRRIDQGLSEVNRKVDQEVARLDQRIDSTYRRARLWSMIGF